MNRIPGPIIFGNMQCCYNQVNSKSLEGTSDFSCIENKGPCIWHIQTANVFQSGFVWATEEFSFGIGADRILTNSSPPWGKNESSCQGQHLVPTWFRSALQVATFHLPLHPCPGELEPEVLSTKAEADCKALWPVRASKQGSRNKSSTFRFQSPGYDHVPTLLPRNGTCGSPVLWRCESWIKRKLISRWLWSKNAWFQDGP